MTTPLTDYIAAASEPAKSVLERFRLRALAIAPDCDETTSYGMAALRYRGRPLIAVITTMAGYSVYPFSGSVTSAVAPLMSTVRVTKGGAAFSDASMLTDEAFDALVRARIVEIESLA